MEKIIAHFRKDENGQIVEQLLRDHLVNVAEKMEVEAKPWGLGALAKLTGLLHDFSKSRSKSGGEYLPFQRYIRLAMMTPKRQFTIAEKSTIRRVAPSFYQCVIRRQPRQQHKTDHYFGGIGCYVSS